MDQSILFSEDRILKRRYFTSSPTLSTIAFGVA
jgi:hypothetical protein